MRTSYEAARILNVECRCALRDPVLGRREFYSGVRQDMETGNAVRDKSYKFALDVVKLVRQLRSREKEYQLTSQLIRSATSVGANVEEAIAGQSRRDFVAKMAIASKEAREAKYWLRLLADAGMVDSGAGADLQGQCDELVMILTAIVKTGQRSEAGRRR